MPFRILSSDEIFPKVPSSRSATAFFHITLKKTPPLRLVYPRLRSLKYFFQSYSYWEGEGDHAEELSRAISNVGYVLYKMGNFDKSLEYSLRALKMKEEKNISEGCETIYLNLAMTYCNFKNFPIANQYFDKLKAACANNCRTDMKIPMEYGFGYINFFQKKYDSAFAHFKKSLTLAEEQELHEYFSKQKVDSNKLKSKGSSKKTKQTKVSA